MDRETGKGQRAKGTRKIAKTLVYSFFLSVLTLCPLPFAFCHGAVCADPWPGVDESVVEKFAREHGRASREPLINTDQGDLLLFVFLLAGTIGGFAAGYYWRVLLEGKATAKGNGKEKRK